ncbi:DUF3483 domain-containing protein [Salinisphaera orenii]|uniref:DUF3483 domain-containing protein n=1 Tax=Salinisphaera orenii TaxID=856731 RepID=UPI000DBE9603
MVYHTAPASIYLAGLIVLAVAASVRAARWRRGRPTKVAIWRGLAAMPQRYLHDVHEVVTRDPVSGAGPGDSGKQSARMHMMAAGGFVAASVLIIPVHIFGVGGTPLAWLLLLTLVGMAVGVGMEWHRRYPRTPARLSKGDFSRLPFGLTAFVVFFIATTLPSAGVIGGLDWASIGGALLLLIGLYAALECYGGLAFGALHHALAGALHLAWHPRPGRFAASPTETGLAPLDLTADKLGVETPQDFNWNQLLGFDACVECGRCQTACPAYAAGLPLNPKNLIQDITLAAQGRTGAYAGAAHPDRDQTNATGGPDQALIGSDATIHPDTLWACTTCRACVEECPMMIEHVDAVIDLRRFQTLEEGGTPAKGSELLDTLRETDTMSGQPATARSSWTTDLSLPHIGDVESADVLLWFGESGFELRNQKTLRALIQLLKHAGVNIAMLGHSERDCGDIARRMGDEATFQRLAKANIETLGQYRFNRIVTADPHVYHTIKNEYPAMGGDFDIWHHTTFLAGLIDDERLAPTALPDESLTMHDPCYLGRYNDEISAPRRILDALGVERREMERSGKRSMCCGSGGGMAVNDIPGQERISDVRMDQVDATGAATVAVACPHCATMLDGAVNAKAEVTDVAELLWQGVEANHELA